MKALSNIASYYSQMLTVVLRLARITFELWNYSSIRPATIKDGSVPEEAGLNSILRFGKIRSRSQTHPHTAAAAAAVHLSAARAFATLPFASLSLSLALVFAANIERAQFVYLQAGGCGGGRACCNYENGY
jgi:hypothetical protein